MPKSRRSRPRGVWGACPPESTMGSFGIYENSYFDKQRTIYYVIEVNQVLRFVAEPEDAAAEEDLPEGSWDDFSSLDSFLVGCFLGKRTDLIP
jgi:hypothetical protein